MSGDDYRFPKPKETVWMDKEAYDKLKSDLNTATEALEAIAADWMGPAMSARARTALEKIKRKGVK